MFATCRTKGLIQSGGVSIALSTEADSSFPNWGGHLGNGNCGAPRRGLTVMGPRVEADGDASVDFVVHSHHLCGRQLPFHQLRSSFTTFFLFILYNDALPDTPCSSKSK